MASRMSELMIIENRLTRLSEELVDLHARHQAMAADQRKHIANIELAKKYLSVIADNRKNFKQAPVVSLQEYTNLKALETRNKLAFQHATKELESVQVELIEYVRIIKELETEMAQLQTRKSEFGRIYEFPSDHK